MLTNVAWADYFGREFVGTIRGALTPFTTGASALGPVLVGFTYDFTGTLFPAFVVLLAMFLIAAALVLLAKPPVKE